MASTENSESVVAAPPPGGMAYSANSADLDEGFYDPAEAAWLSDITGIAGPDELKKHLLQIQREVYAIHPYPCIRLFKFAKQNIAHFPIYGDLLRLPRDRPDALFLELACGVGNDTRKAVVDGFPADRVVATDIHPEFWDIGHRVFLDTPALFPVKFVAGDVFDDAFLPPAPVAPTGAAPADRDAPPDLASLSTLAPLRGRVGAIYASSFFHLFGEAQQAELARRLAGLLSPTPGSFIFGSHVGRPESGLRVEFARPNVDARVRMFCHSPESWRALWEGVLGKGAVEVWAVLKEVQRRDMPEGVKAYIMAWSVKRL